MHSRFSLTEQSKQWHVSTCNALILGWLVDTGFVTL